MRTTTLAPGWLAAPLLALGLAACDTFDYDDNIEGWYAYGGTLDDAPGYTVNGELRIHDQYYDEAYVDIEWHMLEGSTEIFQVLADDVPVFIESDGRLRFTVWGDVEYSDGTWSEFELEHEGRLRGRTLSGHWWLDTDLPSSDEGRFSARR